MDTFPLNLLLIRIGVYWIFWCHPGADPENRSWGGGNEIRGHVMCAYWAAQWAGFRKWGHFAHIWRAFCPKSGAFCSSWGAMTPLAIPLDQPLPSLKDFNNQIRSTPWNPLWNIAHSITDIFVLTSNIDRILSMALSVWPISKDFSYVVWQIQTNIKLILYELNIPLLSPRPFILDVSGIIEKFNVYAMLAIIPRTKEINKPFWLVHIFIKTLSFLLLWKRISLLYHSY